VRFKEETEYVKPKEAYEPLKLFGLEDQVPEDDEIAATFECDL